MIMIIILFQLQQEILILLPKRNSTKIKQNLLLIKESEVNNVITRVKALIITSNNKILLGHSHSEYQFPGGHIETGESLLLGLERELKEETGLVFDTSNLEPFVVRNAYYKDYPKENINTKIIFFTKVISFVVIIINIGIKK